MTAEERVTRRPLAILQVSTRDILGGAESSAWNLFQAYRRAGLDSWLAVGTKLTDAPGVYAIPNDSRRPSWVNWLRRAQRNARATGRTRSAKTLGALAWVGEPRRFIEARLLGREDFSYPGCAALLRLPPRRPDIVHCHNLHGNYFDLRVLPELSAQVPVVLNLRDEWLLTGHCAYALGCERWRDGCGRCPDLEIYPAVPRDSTAYNWRRKRRIFAASRLYISAPSRWLLDRAIAALGGAAGFRLIANAIDLTTFRPADRAAARTALGLPQEAWVIVFSAHHTFKDLATVREALARLEVEAPLMALCLGAHGAPERLGRVDLRFCGFIPRPEDVAAAIQAADVFVHAALGEAFGKGAAEAMACGVPVVATDVGGLSEVVRHGIDGLLVPAKDPGALATALTLLIDDAPLCKDLGTAGHLRAYQEFSIARQVDEFQDWYREVITDWQAWRIGHVRSGPDPQARARRDA